MPFVIMSLSYLLFTITDGALRMIVLLHAYNKVGISPYRLCTTHAPAFHPALTALCPARHRRASRRGRWPSCSRSTKRRAS